MTSWTPEALDLFHRQCEERRDSLRAAGADPDELFIEWESLIASRAVAAGESEVAPARVQAELPALLAAPVPTPQPPPPAASSTSPMPASPEAPTPAPPPSDSPAPASENAPPPATDNKAPAPAPPRKHRQSWRYWTGTILLWALGVVLPLGVLGFELVAGFCAEVLFDPIPTWAHILLVALVPAANAAVLSAASRAKHKRWLGWVNGAAIGISAFYALQFAIPTPFAVLAVAYFGIGLIPLAPLLAFGCSLALRRRLRRAAATTPLPRWWRTAAPAFLLLLLLGMPQFIVPPLVARIHSPDPLLRARTTKILRALGNREALLNRCYRPLETLDLFSVLLRGSFPIASNESRADAQTAYYRVTGTPYNAVPPPRIKGFRGQTLLSDDGFDPALGGDQVAARIRNLTLTQSRLDGHIEAASGLAYLEWSLEFHNASPTEREARALIELPPGASVSRVTLWIHDEPCEAAFGGRAQTRQAYQQVAVQQRRDPVLVTTAGPDRVLLQCFPVPVDGSMKTRIGITAPLAVPDATVSEARLRLPAFAEHNFGTSSNLQTVVWIESDQGVRSDHPALFVAGPVVQASVRGQISADSSEPPTLLHVLLPQPLSPLCARDKRLPSRHAVLQTLAAPVSPPAFPPALAIVIDGSRRMKPHAPALRSLLHSLPPETEILCILAADLPRTAEGPVPDRFLHFTGGCDNGPALVQAAQWAYARNYAPILWLHAAQPLESTDLEALRQIADFSRGRLIIHSHQFGPGANRLAEQIADLDLVHPVPAVANLVADIPAALRGQAGRWQRQCLPDGDLPAGVAEGSSHIARLWAADEIARLCAPPRLSGREDAIQLARDWQLVSSVSGAVVLESSAQYAEHHLVPVPDSTTPAIVPEPATGLLLLSGAAFLLARRRIRTPQ